ncbi:MAG: hypothetical protein ACYTGH_07430 [Planctomycetota bacterium]
MRSRLIELSEIFAVEICGYAIMSNHLHIVVRNRPDLRAQLSDREVRDGDSSLPGRCPLFGRVASHLPSPSMAPGGAASIPSSSASALQTSSASKPLWC